MNPKIFQITTLLVCVVFFLSACQPSAGSQPGKDPTGSSALITPPASGYPATLENPPAAGGERPDPATPDAAYPAPADSGASALWLAYPPAAGDDAMGRANFFVDSAELRPVEGAPGQADLYVEGSLPTPCNQPRLTVNPPDAEKKIVIEIYSLVPKDKMCTQVIQPYSGKLATLAGYPSGTYTVMVNEVAAGELVVP